MTMTAINEIAPSPATDLCCTRRCARVLAGIRCRDRRLAPVPRRRTSRRRTVHDEIHQPGVEPGRGDSLAPKRGAYPRHRNFMESTMVHNAVYEYIVIGNGLLEQQRRDISLPRVSVWRSSERMSWPIVPFIKGFSKPLRRRAYHAHPRP